MSLYVYRVLQLRSHFVAHNPRLDTRGTYLHFGDDAMRTAHAGEEAVRSAFINVDQAGIGSLSEHQFESALRQAGIELTRHQIISLHRRLAKDGKVQVEDVLRVLI